MTPRLEYRRRLPEGYLGTACESVTVSLTPDAVKDLDALQRLLRCGSRAAVLRIALAELAAAYVEPEKP